MFVNSNGSKYRDAYVRSVHSYGLTAQFVCFKDHVVTPSPMFSHGMSIMVQTNDFYCTIYPYMPSYKHLLLISDCLLISNTLNPSILENNSSAVIASLVNCNVLDMCPHRLDIMITIAIESVYCMITITCGSDYHDNVRE